MDDCSEHSNKQFRNGLVDSMSYIICGRKNTQETKEQAELFRSHPLRGNNQKSGVELRNVQVRTMSPVVKKTVESAEFEVTAPRLPNSFKTCPEPYCQVKLESINKLKDSTRKLLYLLDDIQSKTYSKDFPPSNTNEITTNITSSTVQSLCSQTFPEVSSITDITEPALKYLETQTKELNNIYIEDDDDDCSVFKRLTRKCNCLNQQEYNDFIIHFNEDTKYSTNTIGEIIKNIRILKKFLYMGGTYTKNALIFLNEGLEKSSHKEKTEIMQGCAHADLCNVFENHSIVITCISWPCRYANYGDNFTQNLAASVLHKLSQLEEGRRYLKYTSKITNDIKKVLRKRGSQLNENTKECLSAVVNLLLVPLTQNVHYTYYCRENGEGNLNEIINTLQLYRKHMTLDEVFMYLEFLQNFSNAGKGKTDLTLYLPSLLLLFKDMLKEYDNSEMNIIVIDILTNIITKNMLKQKEEEDEAKNMSVVDTATEPVETRNQIVQMPQVHKKSRYNKSKLYLGSTKFHQTSRRKDGKSIIVVPIEKKKKTSL